MITTLAFVQYALVTRSAMHLTLQTMVSVAEADQLEGGITPPQRKNDTIAQERMLKLFTNFFKLHLGLM